MVEQNGRVTHVEVCKTGSARCGAGETCRERVFYNIEIKERRDDDRSITLEVRAVRRSAAGD